MNPDNPGITRASGLFMNLLAFLPKLHLLHLDAPFALKLLRDQGGVLLVAILLTVFGRGEPMVCQVPLGDDLEGLAAFQADGGVLL